MAKGNPKGIGGWLLLFILGQMLAIVASAAMFVVLAASSEDLEAFYQVVPSGAVMIGAEKFFLLFRAATGLLGLLLIFTRSSMAPSYWKFILAVILVGCVFDFVTIQKVIDEVRGGVAPPLAQAIIKDFRSAANQALGGGAATLLWPWYWFVSVRVRNTFGGKGGDQELNPQDREILDTFGSDSTAAPVASDLRLDLFRGRPTRECPHCGERILASAEFCRHCKEAIGGTLTDPAALQTPTASAGTVPAPAPPGSSSNPPPPDPPAPGEPSSP